MQGIFCQMVLECRQKGKEIKEFCMNQKDIERNFLRRDLFFNEIQNC